jgi:hypothetical protein
LIFNVRNLTLVDRDIGQTETEFFTFQDGNSSARHFSRRGKFSAG